MNPIRKKRLIIVLFLVFGVAAAVGLALVALQQNINLFFSPTQIAEGEAPVGQRIRGGGLVVAGSVNRDTQSLKVHFEITDGAKSVPVEYVGILPDLFREGQGIVAQGAMREDGVFEAVEVLAKHDENYMPPEVQEAIDKAGHPTKSTES
ncbi:cytochrome c maturation protein CcmE [Aestuariirhabdus litorea]|uniref:Cytochrome c-type biogenesis protein CcmE n=1 Tax=Aestuariirhabdus litorea TaxID=2528527 RepID=A0A3P3VPQ0_9GAMM|nr:cytochrome c maturation protein CcmE [Aestuariirhabdus litorea]RRJ84414.1 cytochrome c maturation protein CcmE [Aestuariirhabdus litorea]RWW97638.1 cytochrome c maturation protein CcmE [Endozoicomonadaceae bacterium GTF-13]